MNQNHSLSPELQYDFYFYSMKGKRFGFPPKQEDPYNLEVVMEYYQISKQKALEHSGIRSLILMKSYQR